MPHPDNIVAFPHISAVTPEQINELVALAARREQIPTDDWSRCRLEITSQLWVCGYLRELPETRNAARGAWTPQKCAAPRKRSASRSPKQRVPRDNDAPPREFGPEEFFRPAESATLVLNGSPDGKNTNTEKKK